MPTAFDMVVVGAGGGPDETNLSAYLLKPHDASWEDGTLALEAGSAQGALSKLLQQDPLLFKSHGDLIPKKYTAVEIYSFLRGFLITHAHLDHISGLVISAGSFQGPRKRVYATKQTLDDLESVFSDRIWPNLASWNDDDDDSKLLYSTLPADNEYRVIHPSVSVRTIPVNHGRNANGIYKSAAFFIRHETHNREFLFFGDVEPDALAPVPQTFKVWRAAAPKIPHTLSAIFIECSWPSGRADELLYGHLNPEHLVDELTTLAVEVVRLKKGDSMASTSPPQPIRKKMKKNPISQRDLVGVLDGVRVYVMHCKDSLDPKQCMRQIIVSQVRTLVEGKGLGAQVIAVEQGMYINI